uniref:Uncharacterized protein n=1 Tax=Anguilla anguilla TaxID=7936 RepID=A0A0E9THQ7_ANGAN
MNLMALKVVSVVVRVVIGTHVI